MSTYAPTTININAPQAGGKLTVALSGQGFAWSFGDPQGSGNTGFALSIANGTPPQINQLAVSNQQVSINMPQQVENLSLNIALHVLNASGGAAFEIQCEADSGIVASLQLGGSPPIILGSTAEVVAWPY